MKPQTILDFEFGKVVEDLGARQQPFACATIVRSSGATAAKAGAKAILAADGTILHGWLGGGCTRGAVKRFAVQALKDGKPQMVSIAPEEQLEALGVAPGDEVDGTHFARNGCPSRGTIDVFIEPYSPQPELVVLGASPVAKALATLAPSLHWSVTDSVTAKTMPAQKQVIVIATQGQGDLDALKTALSGTPDYVAFVGSGRKYAMLAGKLSEAGFSDAAIRAVNSPAGLNLGAITPEEIALSILAQLVQHRRQNTQPGTEQVTDV